MGMLDDTAIFNAVVQQGGFSRAAKHLGLSNGMISRRIAELETNLGVTLIKRTTRQLHLTPEGELFWHHTQRIQQELDAALSLIQSSAKKPKGTIRISAPLYFGRHYLTDILLKFLRDFADINIDLILNNQRLDPVKEQLDLVIRGAGYLEDTSLQDSSLQMKLLLKEKIGLYASIDYITKNNEPKTIEELPKHLIINHMKQPSTHQAKWDYEYNGKHESITFAPKLNCNDIESTLTACINGHGIGKFTELNVKKALGQQQLRPVLQQYNFGLYHLYAIYPHQHALPRRTRLLLDFIIAHTQHLLKK